MPLSNSNTNTIPSFKRDKGSPTPPPPVGDFIALEINTPGLPDVMALESALTDKVELE